MPRPEPDTERPIITDDPERLQERLGDTSTASLVDTVIILTHRIHGMSKGEAADVYRARRDIVRAEVIRRAVS